MTFETLLVDASYLDCKRVPGRPTQPIHERLINRIGHLFSGDTRDGYMEGDVDSAPRRHFQHVVTQLSPDAGPGLLLSL
ncbi:hypothetical protein D3C76_1374580 [compost metagenome]